MHGRELTAGGGEAAARTGGVGVGVGGSDLFILIFLLGASSKTLADVGRSRVDFGANSRHCFSELEKRETLVAELLLLWTEPSSVIALLEVEVEDTEACDLWVDVAADNCSGGLGVPLTSPKTIVGAAAGNVDTMLAGGADTIGRIGFGCTMVDALRSSTSSAWLGITTESGEFWGLNGLAEETGRTSVKPACSMSPALGDR